MTTPRDRRLARSLIDWFEAEARDLPWRRIVPSLGRRDAYRSLVSEVMLQQTQVARVEARFVDFLIRFPTAAHLARADEQSVLAAWSGLGYYRRALNLHRAAAMIVEEFGGEVPRGVASLRRLPGVGRYTAGAIASMVFGDAEPLVDGNVQRVLLRVEGREVGESDRAREAWAWSLAEGLVKATPDPGALNEALMELGALVCLPAQPRCAACPVSRLCVARRGGVQNRIPRASRQAVRRDVYHSVVIVRSRGRVLVEQRPDNGLWARMWQAPTVERSDRAARRSEVVRSLELRDASPIGCFDHATTHRRVRFEIWRGVPKPKPRGSPSNGRMWANSAELRRLPMSNPQRRILLEDRQARAQAPFDEDNSGWKPLPPSW